MRTVLTLLPDGRGVLTVDQDLAQDQFRAIREAYQQWAASDKGVLILSGTVEHATEIELELEPVG